MLDSWDTVIVGGGIVGVVLADHLRSERPHERLLVLEKDVFGGGATARAAGLATSIALEGRPRRLTEIGSRFYRRLRAREARMSLRELPLLLVPKSADPRSLHQRCPGAEALPWSEARDRFLDLARWFREPSTGVAFLGDDALQGSPARICEGLVESLREGPNASAWEGVALDAIEPSACGLRLTLSDGCAIDARRVVCAVGPWLPFGVARRVAAANGVRTKKIVSLHVDVPASPTSPVVHYLDHGAFLLPQPSLDQWVFSYTCERWDCRPDADEMAITAEDRELGVALLAALAPEMAPHVRGGRSFCDAYGPARLPVVAADPELDGLFVAGCGSGSGFRFAPGIAVEVAELVAAREHESQARSRA